MLKHARHPVAVVHQPLAHVGPTSAEKDRLQTDSASPQRSLLKTVPVSAAGAGGEPPPGGKAPLPGHYGADRPQEVTPLAGIRMARSVEENAARRRWQGRIRRAVREQRRYGTGQSSTAEGAAPPRATPYARVTVLTPDGRAAQNAFYNRDGDVHYHVDFASHGNAPSGHWHEATNPGQPGSLHQGVHYPPSTVPLGFLATHGGAAHRIPPGYTTREIPPRPGPRRTAAVTAALGGVVEREGLTPPRRVEGEEPNPDVVADYQAAYFRGIGDGGVAPPQ